MSIKVPLRKSIKNFITPYWKHYIYSKSHIQSQSNEQFNDLNIFLQSALSNQLAQGNLNHPVAFVKFLRGCVEPSRYSLTTVKTSVSENTVTEQRFQALLEVLETNTPPISFTSAVDIAKMADEYLENFHVPGVVTTSAGNTEKAIFDICYEFTGGSSGPSNGRIFNTVIRFIRPQKYLELGTFYGMSGMFILSAQASIGNSPNLTTLDHSEVRIALTSKILKHHFGDGVKFIHGYTQNELPKLAESSEKFDFLYHDAGHKGEDYINDFQTILPVMEPGSIVIFDDIRWSEACPVHKQYSIPEIPSYEGWLRVASHDRVRRAVEVGSRVGLLLLK